MLRGQGHWCGPSILEMIAHMGFSDRGRQRPNMAFSLASLGLKAGHHGQGAPLPSTVGQSVLDPAPPHGPGPWAQPASCCRDTTFLPFNGPVILPGLTLG